MNTERRKKCISVSYLETASSDYFSRHENKIIVTITLALTC